MPEYFHTVFMCSIFAPSFLAIYRMSGYSSSQSGFLLVIGLIFLPVALLYLSASISCHLWLTKTCMAIVMLFATLLSFLLLVNGGGMALPALAGVEIILSILVLFVAAILRLHRRLTHHSSGTPNGAP